VSLRFDVITLFPEMFAALTASGITRRALERGLWQIECWNPRQWTQDVHRTVDDRPYGGGPGMVMMASPLEQAINAAKAAAKVGAGGTAKVIVPCRPRAARIDQRRVAELAASEGCDPVVRPLRRN
jgi:tRNA (guanine37-N1)-methyltransferase